MDMNINKTKNLLVFCLLLSQNILAQKEAWHWYFGGNAGIDFSSGTATLVTGALNTVEGCASISDAKSVKIYSCPEFILYPFKIAR